jgi:hypothetical protein
MTAATPPRSAVAAESGMVGDLLAMTERLVELVSISTSAANGRRIDAIKATMPEVTALARGYEAKVRQLAAAGPLPIADRHRIAAATARLREVLVPYERRLRAAVETQRRLIGCIAKAASAATTSASPYSRSGSAAAASARRAMAAPVAVNRAL